MEKKLPSNIDKGLEILKYGHRQNFKNASLVLADYWKSKEDYLVAVKILMNYPHDLNCQVEIGYCYYLYCKTKIQQNDHSHSNSIEISDSHTIAETSPFISDTPTESNSPQIRNIKHKSISILKDAANQDSALAWFYLSHIVKSKNQQIKCLLMSLQLGYSAEKELQIIVDELIDAKDPDNILHQMGKLLLLDCNIKDRFNLAIKFFMYSLESIRFSVLFSVYQAVQFNQFKTLGTIWNFVS